MNGSIYRLYCELYQKYGLGKKFWPQWCTSDKTEKDREKVAIGAILTQRTSWHNADLALKNLKKEKLLSFKKISNLKSIGKLTELVRPAGFYQTKPKRLTSFCSFVLKEYGSLERFRKEDLNITRNKLLSLYGIGPETADTILLYALDRPSFIIDEYTKRLVKEKGLSNNFSYDSLKDLFEKNLPKNIKLYQNFHTLMIVEQKGREGSMMEKV